jgi:hypothetical protein
VFAFIVFPIIVGIVFEPSYQRYRKKLKEQFKAKLTHTPQGDEPQQEQITSIPEKQITDELH